MSWDGSLNGSWNGPSIESLVADNQGKSGIFSDVHSQRPKTDVAASNVGDLEMPQKRLEEWQKLGGQ